MIQDLSNHGMRPTWLAEESWIADWCARRSNRRAPEVTSTEPVTKFDSPPIPPTPTFEPPVTPPPLQSATVELLHQRIDDQKHQIDMLRGQLVIKDEQIRTANQLADQSQQLMRELYVLLKNVQGFAGGGDSSPDCEDRGPQSI